MAIDTSLKKFPGDCGSLPFENSPKNLIGFWNVVSW